MLISFVKKKKLSNLGEILSLKNKNYEERLKLSANKIKTKIIQVVYFLWLLCQFVIYDPNHLRINLIAEGEIFRRLEIIVQDILSFSTIFTKFIYFSKLTFLPFMGVWLILDNLLFH